jgi:hypothetical protein
MMMNGLRWSTRIGPLRIRLQDELRPFAIGVCLIVGLAVLNRHSRLWRRVTAIAFVAFSLAGLLALARQAQPVMEVSDGAILEIYTLHALQGKLLLGPYSRLGWNHPGPLYAYLQAPWYLLSGYRTAGMQAGALAMNLSSLVVIAWTVARSGSSLLAISVTGLVALYVARTGEMVVSAWNPHVLILPTAAFVVLCAAMAANGELKLLPWIALIASFMAQTHVALVPLASVLAIVSVIVAVAAERGRARDAASGQWRRFLSVTAWLLAVLWLLPIAEELTQSPGNLTRLWRFFVVEPRQGQDLTAAVTLWSTALSAPFRSNLSIPWGLAFRPPDGIWPIVCGVLQVPLLLLAAVMAHRAGRRYDGWLALLCAAASLVALWSTTRIFETVLDHEIFWMSVLGVVSGAVILAALGNFVGDTLVVGRSVPRVTTAGACGLSLLGCAAAGLIQMNHVLDRSPDSPDDRAVRVLSSGIQAYVSDAHVRRPLFRIDTRAWTIAAGALLQLDKAGVPFAVEDNLVTMFGEALAVNGREDAELTFAGPAAHGALSVRPENQLVAEHRGIFVDAIRVKPNSNR